MIQDIISIQLSRIGVYADRPLIGLNTCGTKINTDCHVTSQFRPTIRRTCANAIKIIAIISISWQRRIRKGVPHNSLSLEIKNNYVIIYFSISKPNQISISAAAGMFEFSRIASSWITFYILRSATDSLIKCLPYFIIQGKVSLIFSIMTKSSLVCVRIINTIMKLRSE